MKHIFLLVGCLLCTKVVAQQAPTSSLNDNDFTAGEGATGALANSVNLFTGSVNFPVSLVSLPGRNGANVNVGISYSSAGVRQSVGTWNMDAPTSILGLGWSMDMPKIVVDNKQTGTRTDDEFYLVEGGTPTKLFLKNAGTPQVYITERYTPWIIEYYAADERWEITKEDGTRILYGERNSSRSTVEWVWKWDNWIGNSTQTSSLHSLNVQQQAVAWNLSHVISHWDDTVTYQYEQVNRQRVFGDPGLQFDVDQTEASYLTKITGPTGQTVEFLYEEKCGPNQPCAEGYVEYMDPNIAQAEGANTPGDAYQERYETRYLRAIETYSQNDNQLNSIEFGYDFIGTGDQAKRLLSSITRVNASGEVQPATNYNYLTSGSMTGAMNQVVSSSGATTDYYYDEPGKELTQASRQKLAIQAPDRYAEPRVWVEDDYVLVSWRVKGTTHSTDDRDVKLFVYQWVGRWIETELFSPGTGQIPPDGVIPTFEADVLGGFQNFEVATQKDFIAILPKAKLNGEGTNPSKRIFLYTRDRDNPGEWEYINFSIPNSAGWNTYLLAGDNFAGVLTERGYLETFVLTRANDNFGWRKNSFEFPVLSNGLDDYIGSATNNYILVQHVADASPAPIYIRYLDESLTWGQTNVPSGLWFSAYEEQTDWQLSNSFAAVQNHGNNADSYIFQWDENFENIRRTSVGSTGNYNQGLLHYSTAQNNALYASVRGNTSTNDNFGNAQIVRFDGAAWQPRANVGGQKFGSYSFGQDEFLRQAPDGTDYLAQFDPNTRTWSENTIPFATGDRNFRMSNRLLSYHGEVYFRNQLGNWQEGESPIALTFFEYEPLSGLARDGGYTPFVLYEGNPNRFRDDMLVTKFYNDGRIKNNSFQLPGDGPRQNYTRYTISDPDANATVYDRSNLVGRNILVTYLDPDNGNGGHSINFEDVTEFNLLLINSEPETANNHNVTVFPVSRIETNDGMDAARVASFDYDLATATLDVSGTQPQFGSVKIVPNSADPALTPNGFTEYSFYNSLTPETLTPVRGYLSGVAYETKVFNSDGITTPVSSSTTSWEVKYANAKNQDNVTIVGQFQVRPTQQISTVDEVTTTVDYAYYDIDEAATGFGYGMLRNTTTTNVDAAGDTDVVVTTPTYFWSTYPFTEDLNLVSPVVETKKQVNGTITDVAATTWKNWGDNHWAPHRSYVWEGTGDSDFGDWLDILPSLPLTDWLLTSKVLERDDRGNVTSSIDTEGIRTNVLWDATQSLPINQEQLDSLQADRYEVSYAYDEDYRYVTQVTDDIRNTTVRYLYDDNQRRIAVINEDGLPQETTAAYRSVDYNNDTFSATDPDLIHQTMVRGSQGLYEDFGGATGNVWQETETGNGTQTDWLVQDGRLRVNTTGGGSGQPDVYALDLAAAYQGRVGVEFTVTTNEVASDYALGFGLGELGWNAADGTQAAVWSSFFGYEEWRRFSGNTWQPVAIGLLPSHSFRMKIVADTERDVADFYVDGKLMDADVPFQSTASGIQKIAFVQYGRGVASSWIVDNVIVYTDPVHVTTYYDAGGKVRQVQTEESATELLVSETLYDELGRGYLETKPTLLVGRFGYFEDLVTGIDANGVLNGLVSTGNPGDNGYPYSRTRFESSPLSRPIAAGLPGDEFQLNGGHATQTLYTNYSGAERFALIHPTTGQTLPTGEYILQRLTDADGVQAYSVADKAGNMVGEVVETFDGTNYTHYTTQYEYDDQGRVTAMYPPNYWNTPTGATATDYVTRYQYDFLGRLEQETTPDGGTTTYIYDAIGRPVRMQDANATAEENELYVRYDDWGRVAEEGYIGGISDPESFELSGAYTGLREEDARVMTTADPTTVEPGANVVLRAGESITLSTGFHAKAGGLFHARIVDSLTIWRKRYVYATATDPAINQRGRLVTVEVNQDTDEAAEVTETYTYDNRGNVLTVIQTVEGQAPTTITYAYDNLDQVTTVNYGDTGAPTVVYGYQPYTGRMETVGTSTEADRFARYAYDNNGDLQQEQFNNGGITRNYQYNAPGWLTGISDNYFNEGLSYTSGGYNGAGYYTGQIAQSSFQFNGNAGQWTNGVKPTAYAVQYAYNQLGRLQSAQHSLATLNAYDLGISTPITYDANGNITLLERGGSARAYNYRLADSKPNQVASIIVNGNLVATYQYDANGNVSQTDALPALRYDPYLNLTTRIERPSAGNVTFGYGMADERVFKQDYDSQGELLRSTYYIHGLGSSPLIERNVDEQNSTTGTIYHIYGLNGMLATQASGQWHFMLKDHLGSTRVVTDENDLVAAYYNYSAFGESFLSAESEEFAYRFTGQEYDEETGLHNYKARLYDSELGRFYGIDPAGQYASPYSYVGSNPVSFVDPSGEFAFSLFWFGVGKAALGGALSSAHTAYVNGGNAWQAGLQGGLTSGLGTFFGAFTPPGLVPGAIYGAAINGITGAGAAAFTGGDPARSFGVGAIGGGVSGGVVGGYRAIQEGRGFLFGRDIQTFLLPEITIFMRGGFSMAKSEWWGDTQSFLDQNPVATAVVGAMNQWSTITTNVMLTTASLMAPVPKFGLGRMGAGTVSGASTTIRSTTVGAAREGFSRGSWTLTKQGSSAIKAHKGFGTFYKSKSDGLWWATDYAKHGGSHFKVFQETNKGLQWFRDADRFGDFILNKHKGTTGTFIPWGQLKTVR